MNVFRNILNLPFAVIFFLVSLIALFANLFIPKKSFREIQRKAQERDIADRLSQIDGQIGAGDKVLDVGCGSGKFAKALGERFSAKVSGIDVVDYKGAEIQISLYDGKTIPHGDKEFDVIILAFVLHHVRHQRELLSEAVRCASKRIIIFEDVYFSPWQRLFVIWNDFYTNILFGAVRVWKGEAGKGLLSIPMPLTFRSVKGWKRLFGAYPVAVSRVIVRHSAHKPHSKAVFVLDVKPRRVAR